MQEKKRLQYSLYHSFLRVAMVVFAVLLVFDSGIISDKTKNLSISTQDYLASAVGVRVGVSPNEVNQLTSRITELEQELEAKERLIAVNINNQSSNFPIDKSTLILSIILFILLVLIVMNYILDFLRMGQPKNFIQVKS